MSNLPEKQKPTSLQVTLLNETVTLLKSSQWKLLDQFLPNTIEKGLSMPVISDLIRETSEDKVRIFLEYELVLLASRVSVGGNLSNDMVQFIANELIQIFPNESLADFRLCFLRGAMGQYNSVKKEDIFRLDGIVIRQWMERFLIEKAEARERLIDKFKHNGKKEVPLTPEEERVFADNAKKYIKEWQEQLGKIETKKSPKLSEKEIHQEGQEKPKKAHKHIGPTHFQYAMKKLIVKIAFGFYKDRHLTMNKISSFNRFLIEDIEVFAQSEEDAIIFYNEALEQLTKKAK